MGNHKFDIYKDSAGKYRWRLIAPNGQKVATSGESFANRGNAERAAQRVGSQAAKAEMPKQPAAGGGRKKISGTSRTSKKSAGSAGRSTARSSTRGSSSGRTKRSM